MYDDYFARRAHLYILLNFQQDKTIHARHCIVLNCNRNTPHTICLSPILLKEGNDLTPAL